MIYTEKKIKDLAINNQKELSHILMGSNISIPILIFGIETLGEEVKDEELVIPVLLKLLKHINATVREGALIGAIAFFTDKVPNKNILDVVKHMSVNDPSNIVKELAKELL